MNQDQHDKPSVLFICARNSGKSQMAAALLKHLAGDRIRVDSAGTNPGEQINELSARAFAELGADMTGHPPKRIDANLIRAADLVVVLGREAGIDPIAGTPVETWDTDEPSLRGIDGIERMRLIRDVIAQRVHQLADRLTATA